MNRMGVCLLRCAPALALAAVALAGCTSSTTSSSVVGPSGDKCSVSITSTPSSFTASGGAGSATISAARDCTWSVAADAAWVSITGAHDGQGNAVVPFSVAANPVPSPRTGAIAVGEQRAPVSQAGAPCTFSLSRARDTVTADGGSLAVGLSTLTGCSWSASTSASWLTIVSGQSGNASGTVGLSVAANTGVSRVATMNVGGQTYTVTQEAPPAGPSPAPPPPPPPPVDINGTVLLVLGRCPTLNFILSGTVVTVDGSTSYTGGHCTDIAPGRNLEVTGQTQPDGSVAADQVTFKKGTDDD